MEIYPLFIRDEHLFALPGDVNTLLVIDAISGDLQQKIPMSKFNNAAVMLGIYDDAVCLTSIRDIYLVNWKTYDEASSPKSCIRWSEINFTSNESNEVSGRGCMSAESLYIPTRQRLYQLSWKAQRIVSVFPPFASPESVAGARNLLVTDKGLVAVQPTGVVLFVSVPPTASLRS